MGLDAANGSTWMIAKSVFDALGAQTFVINDMPDGTNINRGCGSTHLAPLQRLVKDNGLDVGFAFDGDADRCLAVDESGNVVNGDAILYFCAAHAKERGELGNTKVVTTVMSNFGLYKSLERLGIGCEITDVGDRFVYENMRRNGHLIGGEQSGHIIFRKYANTGDGMLTAIRIMQVMLDKKLPLSKLSAGLEIFPQVLRNLRVTDRDAAMNDPNVCEAARRAQQQLGDDGRIVLRKSGTEPMIRIMVQAEDCAVCNGIVDRIEQAVRAGGYTEEKRDV